MEIFKPKEVMKLKTFYLTEEVLKKLHELAELTHLSQAEIVRQSVLAMYNESKK